MFIMKYFNKLIFTCNYVPENFYTKSKKVIITLNLYACTI